MSFRPAYFVHRRDLPRGSAKKPFPYKKRRGCVRSGASLVVMSVLSLVGLTGIVFCPQFTYPLLWISPKLMERLK